MMDQNLSNIVIEIQARVDEAIRAIKDINVSLQELKTVTERLDNQFTDFTTTLLGTSVKIKQVQRDVEGWTRSWEQFVRVMKAEIRWIAGYELIRGFERWAGILIRTGFDLEFGLKKIQAVTSATLSEINQFQKVILDTATQSTYSIQDLTEASLEAVRAGLKLSQVSVALPSASKLALLTGEKLTESMKTLISVMMSGGLTTEQEIQRITQVVLGALNLSKLTLKDFNTAFQYLGPFLRTTTDSFEDLAAWMVVFSNAGFQASRIGTSIRQAFTYLLAPTTKLRQTFQQLGVDTSKINPLFRNLGDILTYLRDQGLSAQMIFDALGIRGAQSITFMMSVLEEYKVIRAALAQQPPLEELYKIATEATIPALRQLRNEFLAFSSVVAQSVGPVLTTTFYSLKTALETTRDVLSTKTAATLAFSTAIGTLTYGIVRLSSVLLGLIPGLGVFASTLGRTTALVAGGVAGFTTLGTAIAINTIPQLEKLRQYFFDLSMTLQSLGLIFTTFISLKTTGLFRVLGIVGTVTQAFILLLDVMKRASAYQMHDVRQLTEQSHQLLKSTTDFITFGLLPFKRATPERPEAFMQSIDALRQHTERYAEDLRKIGKPELAQEWVKFHQEVLNKANEIWKMGSSQAKKHWEEYSKVIDQKLAELSGKTEQAIVDYKRQVEKLYRERLKLAEPVTPKTPFRPPHQKDSSAYLEFLLELKAMGKEVKLPPGTEELVEQRKVLKSLEAGLGNIKTMFAGLMQVKPIPLSERLDLTKPKKSTEALIDTLEDLQRAFEGIMISGVTSISEITSALDNLLQQYKRLERAQEGVGKNFYKTFQEQKNRLLLELREFIEISDMAPQEVLRVFEKLQTTLNRLYSREQLQPIFDLLREELIQYVQDSITSLSQLEAVLRFVLSQTKAFVALSGGNVEFVKRFFDAITSKTYEILQTISGIRELIRVYKSLDRLFTTLGRKTTERVTPTELFDTFRKALIELGVTPEEASKLASDISKSFSDTLLSSITQVQQKFKEQVFSIFATLVIQGKASADELRSFFTIFSQDASIIVKELEERIRSLEPTPEGVERLIRTLGLLKKTAVLTEEQLQSLAKVFSETLQKGLIEEPLPPETLLRLLQVIKQYRFQFLEAEVDLDRLVNIIVNAFTKLENQSKVSLEQAKSFWREYLDVLADSSPVLQAQANLDLLINYLTIMPHRIKVLQQELERATSPEQMQKSVEAFEALSQRMENTYQRLLYDLQAGNITFGQLFEKIKQVPEGFDLLSRMYQEFLNKGILFQTLLPSLIQDTVRNMQHPLMTLYNTLQGIGQAFHQFLGDAVYNVLKGRFEGIRDLFFNFINQILDLWMKFLAQWAVHTIVQKVGIPGGFVGLVSKLFTFEKGGIIPDGFIPIRKLQSGGIINKPTLGLIGEGKHAEAVVPLPDNRSIPVKFVGDKQEKPVQATIINVIDPNLLGQYLGSTEGQQVILNVLGLHKETIRRILLR